MSLTFVVPDVHGMSDLLEDALIEVGKHEAGTVIFTGDFIDRGPDSKKCVQRLIDGPSNDTFRWSFVRGNHEDMAIHCADGTDLEWWIRNGGDATLKSYGGEISPDHLSWFGGLARLTWDAHRIYVHAGVDPSVPLDAQAENTTQWHRYPLGANIGYPDKHVVHGHTPTTDGPELFEQRTNLDTGAFFTGRLVVGVFDDAKPGGPIDLIEVTS